jgi:hypothetical protein
MSGGGMLLAGGRQVHEQLYGTVQALYAQLAVLVGLNYNGDQPYTYRENTGITTTVTVNGLNKKICELTTRYNLLVTPFLGIPQLPTPAP